MEADTIYSEYGNFTVLFLYIFSHIQCRREMDELFIHMLFSQALHTALDIMSRKSFSKWQSEIFFHLQLTEPLQISV